MLQPSVDNKIKSSNPAAPMPPRPAKRRVLWLMIAVSFSIVAATVLLSNNQQHLRSLLKVIGRDDLLASPSKRVFATRPAETVIQRRTLPLALNLMLPVEITQASTFLRTWRRTGPEFCRALNVAGIAVSGWAEALISGSGTSECFYERTWSDGEKHRSEFYLVRGNAAGELSTVRVKIVNPPSADGRLEPAFLNRLQDLIEMIGWPDFSGALKPVGEMRDVESSGFGARLMFKKEPSSEASFNLILSIVPNGPLEVKTSKYFARQLWLPLPAQDSG